MQDILFKSESGVFSYRVAGVCVRDGKVLLQKPTNDSAYAFPGGHVSFGETHEQTLMREFREELGADIRVGALLWVGELFFPWDTRPCHQICLYYAVDILDDHTPKDGSFWGIEQHEQRSFALDFHWMPVGQLTDIEVYPTRAHELLAGKGVQHFRFEEREGVCREEIL